MTDYPYMLVNNKISTILERIRSAAKPDKVTQNLLKSWGFSSTNDRAIISVLKRLDFLTEDGVPNSNYDSLRDASKWKETLGQQIKILYKDLFLIDEKINISSEQEIKGAISRVSGKDEKSVDRYFSTFKTLCGLANFSQSNNKIKELEIDNSADNIKDDEIKNPTENNIIPAQFHYNIQIHLPATTEISVYNAIFKSLKDNLII